MHEDRPVVLAVITGADGTLRAVQIASLRIRHLHCPRCGWRDILHLASCPGCNWPLNT